MSRALYHRAIMDWANAGHGAGRLDAPDATATADNPLCGDRVTIDGHFDATGRLSDIGVHVRGCVLCRAAGSVIGKLAVDTDPELLTAIQDKVGDLLKAEGGAPDEPWNVLEAFRPVAQHRSRHDCVLLPFRALAEVLERAPVAKP